MAEPIIDAAYALIAFQTAWRLFQARWSRSGEPTRRPRILFLADRTLVTRRDNPQGGYTVIRNPAPEDLSAIVGAIDGKRTIGDVHRVGSLEPRRVNVQVLAATTFLLAQSMWAFVVAATADRTPALVALHASSLDAGLVRETLGCVIKEESDWAKVEREMVGGALETALRAPDHFHPLDQFTSARLMCSSATTG